MEESIPQQASSRYRKIIDDSFIAGIAELRYLYSMPVERINRYISLSRHNSLFFGSHEGAKRGCVFYSLACSCRCNGINFFDYLSDVLNKAADLPHLTPEACRELLPDKWTKG